MTNNTQTTRPDFCTDEMLTFLDDLRVSGETNMYGAASYLDAEFTDLWMNRPGEAPREYRSSPRAREVLSYWMKTFGQETR